MNTKQTIENLLQYIVTALGDTSIVILTSPSDISRGDYTTNIAMMLGKKLGKNPMELADEFVNQLGAKGVEQSGVEKIEVVKPGFINFWLTKEILLNSLQGQAMQTHLQGKKIIIEFTDPNPFKEFHIGHVYTNTVGQAIANLLERSGAEVKRVNYQGDVGLHVAKSIWGMNEKMTSEKLTLGDIEAIPLIERAKFLGEAYAQGSSKFEESEEIKKEIIEINKKVYASAGSAQDVKDTKVMELYQKGREWSLAYFERIYARLGMKFDLYFFESEVGEQGLKIVQEYLKKNIFEESEGAVIFPGEKYGLHSRVFINSLGLPTYEAKELGLAPKKYELFPYDLSIIITGNEINAYFKVLLKALEQIRPDLSSKTLHISHGMVRLQEGKMSSRTGNVITGMWLLDEANKRVTSKITRDESLDEKTIEQIGQAAVKYAFLKNGIGKDVSFSFDESINIEGNSGPYLQYTYVRTQSVLHKAQGIKHRAESSSGFSNLSVLSSLQEEESLLLRTLYRFSDVVLQAAESYSPSTLCTYLFELAQSFNSFYQACPILNQSEEVSTFRLALTKSTGDILQSGLGLLGIQTPEKM